MKSRIRPVDNHGAVYDCLMFVCPGCAAGGPVGYDSIHMLAVNASEVYRPSWEWNGNLETPTLSPSILTHGGYAICHSFLRDGVFEFLLDSTHPLSGKQVNIPDLPKWAEELS